MPILSSLIASERLGMKPIKQIMTNNDRINPFDNALDFILPPSLFMRFFAPTE
jgi:hypothetical protein